MRTVGTVGTAARSGNRARSAAVLRRWGVPVAFVVVCIIWGTTLNAIKVGLDAGLPPMWFAALRFLLAALLLGLVLPLLAGDRPLGRAGWVAVLPLGAVAIALNFGLVFWGEQRISSGLAGLLVGTQPLSAALLARVVGKERISRRFAIGLAIGLCAVAVLVGDVSAPGAAGLVGQLAVLVGVTVYAGGLVYTAYRLGQLNPVRVAFAETAVGGILLLGWALVTEGAPPGHWTTGSLLALLYLSAVGSCVGLVLSFWLIGAMGARRFSLYAYVTPAVSVAAGVLLLGERLTWRVAVGGALVVVALAAVLGVREDAGRVRLRPRLESPS